MALCFDLMEMVGKQVDVERHKLAMERHKATFNKVLNQLKERGGWMAEPEWNYNDSHWEETMADHLTWMANGLKESNTHPSILFIHYNNLCCMPWWYMELTKAFETRITNSPVFNDYLY